MKTHTLLEEERIDVRPKKMAPLLEMRPAQVAVPLNMFSDCLLETSGAQRKRRGWAVFFSVTFQSILLSILVLLPLIYTEALPAGQLLTYLVAPPPPPPPPPPAAEVRAAQITTEITNGELMAPTRIPTRIKLLQESDTPSANTGGVPGGLPGGIPGGQLGGVIGGMINATRLPMPMPEAPKRIRVSQGISEGMIINKVVPDFPPLARTARIDGVVMLEAIIAKDGTIQKLRVTSGHPMLIPAALAAVKQWRYKPYLLDGEPVEVETVITVTFQLHSQ